MDIDNKNWNLIIREKLADFIYTGRGQNPTGVNIHPNDLEKIKEYLSLTGQLFDVNEITNLYGAKVYKSEDVKRGEIIFF